MRGSFTYGLKGRLTAGIVGFAGVFAGAVAAAQQANLFTLFPPKYTPYLAALPVIALFFTLFAERIQGGASNPEVRNAAHKADMKNELEVTNK